jgi:hypothetical protein
MGTTTHVLADDVIDGFMAERKSGQGNDSGLPLPSSATMHGQDV